MQKLFGFKKIGALSVAGLVSFVAIDAYAQGIPGVATQSDCFNRYTTLVPKANQVTWDGEGQYCMVTGCLDGYTPNADGSDCVVVSQSGGATCGVNLFNPMILTEADFTLTQRNNGEYDATGSWEHLNTYVSNYPFNFIPNKAYKVSYEIECPEEENESVGNTYLTFKLSNGSYVDAYTNVCSGVDGGTRGVTINMPANTTAVGMAVRNVAGTNVSGHEFKISNVMVALSNQSGFVSYNPCIKLATTKMTETRMAAVENRLTGVRNKINTLITQMQTNSSGIGNLQTEKQTRPNASCPVDKKCLLVKDRDNNDNWYEITDCDENAFLSDMGTSIGGGSNPVGSVAAGKYCLNTYDNIGNSRPNCADGEWGHLYTNGMVYGVARAVAIAEAPGTVVTLPNGVAAGDTCVCRVTGYAPLVSGGVYASSQTSVTTDKWVVGGKISVFYYNRQDMPMTDSSCVDVCGFNDPNGLVKASYYASISNSCSPNADVAQMCRYYPFFATAADNVAQVHNNGFVVNNVGSTGCAEGQYFASNPHCSTNGSWIIEYEPSGQHESGETIGYAYGTVGFATVPAGTTQYSMVDLSASDLSMTYTNQNAIVCMVQGYKAASDASETNVTLNKGFVVDVGNAYDTTDVSGYSRYCVDAVSFGSNYSGVTSGQQWFNELSNMCIAY